MHRFVRLLNQFRLQRDRVADDERLTLQELLLRAPVEWHGVELRCPDWSESSHSLAFTLRSPRSLYLLHGMINAYWEPLRFELPPTGSDGAPWRRAIDTALASPDDMRSMDEAPVVDAASYLVEPRSLVVLAVWLEPT